MGIKNCCASGNKEFCHWGLPNCVKQEPGSRSESYITQLVHCSVYKLKIQTPSTAR